VLVVTQDFYVLRLAAATGAVDWRVRPGGAPRAEAFRGTVTPAGRLVVAGEAGASQDSAFPALVAFDPATGAEAWRRTLPADPSGRLRAVSTDAVGNVVAAGEADHGAQLTAFIAVKVSGADGSDALCTVAATCTGPAPPPGGDPGDPSCDGLDPLRALTCRAAKLASTIGAMPVNRRTRALLKRVAHLGAIADRAATLEQAGRARRAALLAVREGPRRTSPRDRRAAGAVPQPSTTGRQR
jgi:putative pyrroloquinoline-quinone binding quinoprotein